MKRCDCYVDRLPEVMAYALHNGAHEKTCPVFRVSGDPVDRIKDESIGEHYANGCERYEAHNIDECEAIAAGLPYQVSKFPYYDYDQQVWVTS